MNTKNQYEDRNVYISIDIETDGSIPGRNSMLSLGGVAYNSAGDELGYWYSKFTRLPGADTDLDTYNWWKGFPEAWEEANKDPVFWKEAIVNFVEWTKSFKTKDVVLMASPATFDGMFVNWYAVAALGGYDQLPWKHRVLDIRTYICSVLKFPYHKAISKSAMELLEFEHQNTSPHFPLADAREQGEMFFAAKRYREEVLYKKKEKWSKSSPKVLASDNSTTLDENKSVS